MYNTLAELFADRSRWTQYDMAKDAQGHAVSPIDPSATCFCILGGITKIYGGPRNEGRYNDVVRALSQELMKIMESEHCTLASYNDDNPHEKVLALVTAAGV